MNKQDRLREFVMGAGVWFITLLIVTIVWLCERITYGVTTGMLTGIVVYAVLAMAVLEDKDNE